jgi:NADH-quinone oxidoreductase subunit E
LGIKPGETTPDWNYSLDTVHCLGACALGPIVVIDGEYSGQVNVNQVDGLLMRTDLADKAEA